MQTTAISTNSTDRANVHIECAINLEGGTGIATLTNRRLAKFTATSFEQTHEEGTFLTPSVFIIFLFLSSKNMERSILSSILLLTISFRLAKFRGFPSCSNISCDSNMTASP